MKIQTIFFIGKPGCGKGDQAKLLSEKTEWSIKSTGQEFRDLMNSDTPVGKKVKSDMNSGLLMPYWFAAHIFLKELFSLREEESAIFEGFNRKVLEAKLVIEALLWLGRPFTVVYLNISDEEVKKRLALRKEIQGRADDNVVEERLKEFYAFTEPVIEMFRTEGMLIEINGEQTREEVAKDIRKALSIE